MKKLMNRHEMPIGSVIDKPGSSMEYETGGWRNYKPVRDTEKCSDCLICWIYCPEGCIKVKDGKIVDIDLKYCKGCGICAEECPVKGKAIQMVEEKKED
ncbi:MAG: 4Fe-4S binding protein [Planctomycetota bacterium]